MNIEEEIRKSNEFCDGSNCLNCQCVNCDNYNDIFFYYYYDKNSINIDINNK